MQCKLGTIAIADRACSRRAFQVDIDRLLCVDMAPKGWKRKQTLKANSGLLQVKAARAREGAAAAAADVTDDHVVAASTGVVAADAAVEAEHASLAAPTLSTSSATSASSWRSRGARGVHASRAATSGAEGPSSILSNSMHESLRLV